MLIVLQAMDAAGKDGTIKHVMSGVNPQGCQVFSFKRPSDEELDHDFLWRYMKALPERGRIGIFNRSYYEEVLVVRVHPEILAQPEAAAGQARTRSSGRSATTTSTLRAAPRAQRHAHPEVLPERLEEGAEEALPGAARRAGKHWKFSTADLKERDYWNDYQDAFEDMLQHTSTKWAPWWVIPADHKWVTRALVAGITTQSIRRLALKPPVLSAEQRQLLVQARARLAADQT